MRVGLEAMKIEGLASGERKFSRADRYASQFGELPLKLAMYSTAMLVLVNNPEEQRLSAAFVFPSFPDVLLLLPVLTKTLSS